MVISPVSRVAHIGKALQDQQWLFESLMVQVEERRSAVENNAKQIEDRSVRPLPLTQLAIHFDARTFLPNLFHAFENSLYDLVMLLPLTRARYMSSLAFLFFSRLISFVMSEYLRRDT